MNNPHLMDQENIPAAAKFSDGWASFSDDWFSSRIANWKTHVAPVFLDRPVVGVEVGCHEGRSCLWMLANAFTHAQARMYCIDLWPSSAIERTFDKNIALSGSSEKVLKRKGDAIEMLRYIPGCDFAYVDADHTARACIVQAGLIWPRLRSGGILVFDDYPWTSPDVQNPPKPGIDAFLTFWEGQYDLLHKQWQVILRKR